MSYVIWKAIFEEGYCVCGGLENFEDSHKLKRGISIGEYFPADALFRMDPDFPKDIKLSDNIRNKGGFMLVSKEIKELIEREHVNNSEYLSVKIINHKGRVASENYFIINPLGIYDAIDLDSSSVKWNNINPEEISTCLKLILKKEYIPADAKMFRLKYFSRHVVLRRDLAEQIKNGSFTGISFTDVQNFKGF